MEARRIREGLWWWSAPHPDWRPEKGGSGGWERMVGCVYYEPWAGAADSLILIDPLAPPQGTPEAERFWRKLDADVRRVGRRVVVLLSSHFHERSAAAVLDRYGETPGAEIWVPAGAEGRVSCSVGRVYRPEEPLPGGIQGYGIVGLQEPETAFHLPDHRALFLSDCLIGTGEGKVRLAPPSWAPEGEEGRARYRSLFRDSVRGLLGFGAEILLVSHGPVVEEGGREMLEEALAAPASGEKR